MTSADDEVLLWDCVTDPGLYHRDIVDAHSRLADAARDGRWADIVAVLDESDREPPWSVTVNDVRVGGRSGFAPLHQAAWHGADTAVVDELLARGAWRTLRSTAGETPADVARRRGHERLAESIQGPRHGEFDTRVADIETLLAALITVELRQLHLTWRMPQLGPLEEHPDRRFYTSVPGMYGGIFYDWVDPTQRTELLVNFASRMDWGPGPHYLVTPRGIREGGGPDPGVVGEVVKGPNLLSSPGAMDALIKGGVPAWQCYVGECDHEHPTTDDGV